MLSQNKLADPAAPAGAVTTVPLVEVNLVTYNHEKFVARAIESVLEQETCFKYRMIIGDDCSADNTQSIIRGYAQQYPERIQMLFASEHRGIAHKDRVGIEVLRLNTAKYVALLDGDDYWTDRLKLQKQVDFLESHHEYVICFHNARMSWEDGTKGRETFCPPDQKETSTLEDLLAGNFIFTGSVMYRRGLFGELPDWCYTIQTGDWALHALNAQYGKIGYLNEVMATYRVHAAGLWSLEKSASQLTDAIALLDNLNAHLGFKYDSQIKASQSKYYEELSDIHQQKGDLIGAKMFLAKRLKVDFSNSRIPHKYFLMKFIRLQFRAFFSRLGVMRNP